MIKQNWDISDEDRIRILNLHESATKKLYLSEQTKVVGGNEKKIESTIYPNTQLGDMFEYGKYESEKVKNKILSLKQSIEDFMKNSDSSKFLVNISAGESRVTNPAGFETRGSLALARADSVKKYFEEIFSELIKKGVLIINSPKNTTEVSIGTTPYGGKGSGDFSDPEKKEKYEAEQFVNFNIAGEGSKTTTKEIDKFLCDTEPLLNEGAYLMPEANYTQVIPWKLNRGEGNVFIHIDTYSMPDIIYFEYDGKVYGNTMFRGYQGDAYRIFVGTALRAKFGLGDLPAQMSPNRIIALENTDKKIMDSLDEMRRWSLVESFQNTFGGNSSLSNPSWMESFEIFDKSGNKKKLLSTLGNEFPWGFLNSKMGSSVDSIGPIKKIDGIDEIKVINVAPVGTTKWTMSLECKSQK